MCCSVFTVAGEGYDPMEMFTGTVIRRDVRYRLDESHHLNGR
jgi:hypothetical protein